LLPSTPHFWPPFSKVQSPGSRRADLLMHATSQEHDDEFKSAVKRIRERKDAERRERLGSAADGATPEGH
jgi:hypothetical protein